MRKVALIVPCYQEAQRFDPEGFAALAALPDVTLVLVDDGSTDATGQRLAAFAARPDVDAEVLVLPRNRGKAEAVRHGLRHALAHGAERVGYADADLATPPAEVGRLIECLESERCAAVLGSRVRILGASIDRSALRHYVARVLATGFSLVLRIPVYDTQCGAKVFRPGPALEAALSERFLTRWSFDVELLGRLLIGAPGVPGLPPSQLRELPLRAWRDVPGSKLGPADAPRVAWEALRVALDLARRRRRVRGG
jgi:glycosyltransferase involved in cell wall biosynthesis